jgi:hypothetical protein
MRILKLTVLFLALLCTGSVQAQRYVKPVFNNVTVSPLTPYGFNYTMLPYASPTLPDSLKRATKQPLVFQLYTPTGDTQTKRPLIIYLPTGNFFPFPANGSCGGTLGDSSNVEFATRLAKMGYVVAVADYRKFWNPTSNEELVRRFTLINAAYRGVQDVRTCVRSFKKSIKENNNPYGIDSTKIIVWGQGTGGYLSYASAYLNSYSEILTTSDPNKFRLPTPAGLVPMIIEAYNGDIYGTSGPHIVDANYNALTTFKIGDTLCIPNHVGYSSNFALAVNMGGALGDSTWMDKGEIPIVSYHVPSDAFAPCGTNILNVPTATGPQPVVEVSGSCDMSKYADAYGNNDIFKTIPVGADPYGALAKSRNGGLLAYMPFEVTPANSSSPWEWTASPQAPATCNSNAASSRSYVDTIITYFAPRACVALGLNCDFFSSTEVLDQAQTGLNASPNPVSDMVYFRSKDEYQMQTIELFDLNGRMVSATGRINTSEYSMYRGDLPSGLYFARVTFKEGISTQKLILD